MVHSDRPDRAYLKPPIRVYGSPASAKTLKQFTTLSLNALPMRQTCLSLRLVCLYFRIFAIFLRSSLETPVVCMYVRMYVCVCLCVSIYIYCIYIHIYICIYNIYFATNRLPRFSRFSRFNREHICHACIWTRFPQLVTVPHLYF